MDAINEIRVFPYPRKAPSATTKNKKQTGAYLSAQIAF